MAAKRSATSELNHDNWENEDEPEERGTFKVASEDALKTRIIKTARRRNPIRQEESDTPSAFVGFTGFSSKPPSADFSFLKDVSAPKTNGVSTSQDGSAKPNPFAQNPSKTVPKFTFGASQPEEYYSRLKGLNESVSKWIAKKVEENPLISLQPIFKDYDKYLAEIEPDNGDKPKTPAIPAFNFAIPSKTTSEKSQEKSSESTAPTFIFGAAANSGGTSKPFSSFTSTASSLAPPISFGSSSQTVKPSSENDTEDNEDEPPKVEVTPVVENDYIYTVRCKVFVKKGSDYADKGVGNLYLKSIENSEKKQLIVRADTNLGNLLLNFILSDTVPVKRLGKKDVMVVAVPTPDEKPPPTPLLLRVKTPEEADNLLETLEKNKK